MHTYMECCMGYPIVVLPYRCKKHTMYANDGLTDNYILSIM
jgi:hypothetical protein